MHDMVEKVSDEIVQHFPLFDIEVVLAGNAEAFCRRCKLAFAAEFVPF